MLCSFYISQLYWRILLGVMLKNHDFMYMIFYFNCAALFGSMIDNSKQNGENDK